MIRAVARHFDDPEEGVATGARLQVLADAVKTLPIDPGWWNDIANWNAAALAAATLPVDWNRRRFGRESFFEAIERFGRQRPFLSK
jgi:hypothetical protein